MLLTKYQIILISSQLIYKIYTFTYYLIIQYGFANKNLNIYFIIIFLRYFEHIKRNVPIVNLSLKFIFFLNIQIIFLTIKSYTIIQYKLNYLILNQS